jgi:hypothetical protein
LFSKQFKKEIKQVASLFAPLVAEPEFPLDIGLEPLQPYLLVLPLLFSDPKPRQALIDHCTESINN